jgi:tetratricopeptide (TPR) repeat protein
MFPKMKFTTTIICLFFVFVTIAQKQNKYQNIADSLLAKGKTTELITYLRKELKLAPKNEYLLKQLGYAHLYIKNFTVAEKYYRDAIAVNTKCTHCYMNIGITYAYRNDTKKATELFDKSITIDPNDAILYATRARHNETINDNMGALADYNRAVKLDSKNTEWLIQRSNYYAAQGITSLALSDIAKAISIAPNNHILYYKRAIIYYNKQQFKEALADIDLAIQNDSMKYDLYSVRGAIYAGLNESKKSIQDYTKAIQLNPEDYTTYYNRSLERYKLEDMEGYCIDLNNTYQQLQKFDPQNLLLKELNDTKNIYCDLTKPSYYYQRGIAFYNLQKFDDAVNIYTIGLQKFPTNAMTLSFRGNAYFAKNDYTNALIDYYASIKNMANLADDIRLNQQHTILSTDSVNNYITNFLADMQKVLQNLSFL